MCILRTCVFGKQVTGFFAEYIILKMFAGLGIEMTRGISLLQVRGRNNNTWYHYMNISMHAYMYTGIVLAPFIAPRNGENGGGGYTCHAWL